MTLSLEDRLAGAEHEALTAELAGLDLDAAQLLAVRDWLVTRRPEQVAPPGGWMVWLILAGRGWGKGAAGSNFVLDRHEQGSERCALVGRTVADVRDVMVKGASGLAFWAHKRGVQCVYVPSVRTVTLTSIGEQGERVTVCTTYTAEEPDQLAGPEHDTAWGDEFAGWAPILDKAGRSAFDNLMLGLRAGSQPQACFSTTPRPRSLVKKLLERDDTVLTRGSMMDNRRNLAPAFIDKIVDDYANTRLGPQEIHGELIDAAGVWFQRGWYPIVRVEDLPAGCRVVRYWDLAHAAESDKNPDPDWTAGAKVAYSPDLNRWWILDVAMTRSSPAGTEEFITATARRDGAGVTVYVEQTPGAGAAIVARYRDVLGDAGFICRGDPVRGTKEDRCKWHSTKAEQGRVTVVEGTWNDAVFDQLEMFTGEDHPGEHDDAVDALSGAFKVLADVAPTESMGAGVAQVKIPSPIRN